MLKRQAPSFATLDEALGPTRQAAVRMLARREHSASELAERLRNQGYPKDAIALVIRSLQDKDLQSDERFVEVFVRSKKSRGQGPMRIRAELEQMAVSDELIGRYLNDDDEEWLALACWQRKKHFGSARKLSLDDKARQQRFLYYKGFSFEHIKAALEDGAD